LKHKCQTHLHRSISVRHQITKTIQFLCSTSKQVYSPKTILWQY